MARNAQNMVNWKDLRDLIREEYLIKSIIINQEFIESKSGDHAYRLQFLNKEREWKLVIEPKNISDWNPNKIKKVHVASRESITEIYQLIIIRHNKMAKNNPKLHKLDIDKFMEERNVKAIKQFASTVNMLSEDKLMQKKIKQLGE